MAKGFGVATSVFGTMFSTASTLLGGKSAQAAYEDQAEALRREADYQNFKFNFDTAIRNQTLKFELAKMNIERAVELEDIRQSGTLAVGMGRARLGKSGVAMDSGSPVSALARVQADADRSNAIARYNDQVERSVLVWNTNAAQAVARLSNTMNVKNLRLQAYAAERAGEDARTASVINAGTSLLGGVSDSYMQYQRIK